MAADLKTIEAVLVWSTLINYIMLLVWFGTFTLRHDWLFTFHSRWFKLRPESFDALNYGGMALYKIAILLFNLVPLIAVHLVSTSGP